MSRDVHSTAVVSGKARLALDAIVGAMALIHDDVEIGPGARIGAGAIIHPGTSIGERVTVQDYAIIGKPPISSKIATLGAQQHGTTAIHDGATIGARATIFAGCTLLAESFIGDNVVLRENCRLGRRSVLGAGVILESGVTIGDQSLIFTATYLSENTIVEDEVFIGARVATASGKVMSFRRSLPTEAQGPTIRRGARVGTASVLHPGIQIGAEAVVAIGAVVFEDVPAATLVLGNPARAIKRVPPDEFLPSSNIS
jgi:acetyltransferase-like isoleucine patch superfamily enzyme